MTADNTAYDKPWQAWPARQLTGTPFVYHAYVGRDGPEETCGHDHRSSYRANVCAAALARTLNRIEGRP